MFNRNGYKKNTHLCSVHEQFEITNNCIEIPVERQNILFNGKAIHYYNSIEECHIENGMRRYFFVLFLYTKKPTSLKCVYINFTYTPDFVHTLKSKYIECSMISDTFFLCTYYDFYAYSTNTLLLLSVSTKCCIFFLFFRRCGFTTCFLIFYSSQPI
jgi:hypothetical protein